MASGHGQATAPEDDRGSRGRVVTGLLGALWATCPGVHMVAGGGHPATAPPEEEVQAAPLRGGI